jgi:hypothetical protein
MASPVVSIYAGDLVSFSQPDPAELSAIHALLDIFGPASSLRTNYVNCSAPPVRYSPDVKRWSHSHAVIGSFCHAHLHLIVLSVQLKVIHCGCINPWNSYAIKPLVSFPSFLCLLNCFTGAQCGWSVKLTLAVPAVPCVNGRLGLY